MDNKQLQQETNLAVIKAEVDLNKGRTTFEACAYLHGEVKEG